ncbi:MAG TPA: DUF4215 domain-containing protein [Candidatus Limnocylindrales bacterium]|nr:DUF4215 domain-containing protein [Candidatus Limnocylindrales bacterium]
MLLATPAGALTTTEIQCRDILGRGARVAAVGIMRARTACVHQKILGSIDVGTDCQADTTAMGGSGTGDAGVDRRLDRHLQVRTRIGQRLTQICDSLNVDLDVDPADVLDPSTTCGSLTEWTEVGECVADLGKAAADSISEILDLQPPAIPVSGEEELCHSVAAHRARSTVFELMLWRSKCYERDDLIQDGGGFYNCDANITPPGNFESTLLLRADKRLQVPIENLGVALRGPCDVNLYNLGFDVTTPDHSGGGFVDRVTLDDVYDSLNDRIAESIYTVMGQIYPTDGYCGDGTVNGSEACDDGNNESNDGCDRDCSTASCGNGSIDGGSPLDLLGEECDDGNNAAEDGCSPTCIVEVCGNGEINLGWGEICDDAGESPACDDNCTPSQCGDNTLNNAAGEQCDTGPANDSNTPDACGDGTGPSLRGACQLPFCGDAVTDSGEICDDAGESIPCDLNCTAASCGDGDLNATRGETCDDGNAADDDGCPSSNAAGNLGSTGHCITATCGDGFTCTDEFTCATGPLGGPEDCDDSGESATCDTDCSTANCGDGQLNTQNVTAPARATGEACDDGDLVDGDGCDGNCTPTGCGNAVVTDGESCDDGNVTNGDGCDDGVTGNCTASGCGNGIVTNAEACDGNGTGVGGETSACDTNCTVASCGDGDLNATRGEDCDGAGETAGCDANCTFRVCGDGTVNATAGETCDDSGESATCDSNCTARACGDGTTNHTAGEECDTTVASASCDANCTFAFCGDGTTNAAAGEDCDDSGESAACNADCTTSTCGDDVLNATDGEQCDDGNLVNGDGCSSTCVVE